MSLTLVQTKDRSARAQSRQLYYNQEASDGHGQTSGTWRCDCSGLTCAVFDFPQGVNCPSTYELVHNGRYLSAPIPRSEAIPYGSVTIVTNEDGFSFGHVAIIIGYDATSDRLQIQEHGGGTGPDIRWLPSGVNYDSDQKYGKHRDFQVRRVLTVTASGTVKPPVVIAKPSTPSKGTPFPYPANEYLGLLTGPDESHGGINATERAQVSAIQRIVGVRVDGEFGPLTLAAVAKWQKAHNVSGANSGRVGPATWKAMGL